MWKFSKLLDKAVPKSGAPAQAEEDAQTQQTSVNLVAPLLGSLGRLRRALTHDAVQMATAKGGGEPVPAALRLNPFDVRVVHTLLVSPLLRVYEAVWANQKVTLTVVQATSSCPKSQPASGQFRAGTQMDDVTLQVEQLMLDLLEHPPVGTVNVLAVSSASCTTHLPAEDGTLIVHTTCEVHVLCPLPHNCSSQQQGLLLQAPFRSMTQHSAGDTSNRRVSGDGSHPGLQAQGPNPAPTFGLSSTSASTSTAQHTGTATPSSGVLTTAPLSSTTSTLVSTAASTPLLRPVSSRRSQASTASFAAPRVITVEDWVSVSLGRLPASALATGSKSVGDCTAAFRRGVSIQLPQETPPPPEPQPTSQQHKLNAIQLLIKVAEALAKLHDRGLVHGGIRPSGIFMLAPPAATNLARQHSNFMRSDTGNLNPTTIMTSAQSCATSVAATCVDSQSSDRERHSVGGMLLNGASQFALHRFCFSPAAADVNVDPAPGAAGTGKAQANAAGKTTTASAGHVRSQGISSVGTEQRGESPATGGTMQAPHSAAMPSADLLSLGHQSMMGGGGGAPAAPGVATAVALASATGTSSSGAAAGGVPLNNNSQAQQQPVDVSMCEVFLPLPHINPALLAAETPSRPRPFALSRQDLEYAAPELVYRCCGMEDWACGRSWSRATDIWSFGMLMWRVISEQRPFANLNSNEILLAKHSAPDNFLRFAEDCPVGYSLLAYRCMCTMPNLRPSMKAVLQELQELQAVLEGRVDYAFSLSFTLQDEDEEQVVQAAAMAAHALSMQQQEGGSGRQVVHPNVPSVAANPTGVAGGGGGMHSTAGPCTPNAAGVVCPLDDQDVKELSARMWARCNRSAVGLVLAAQQQQQQPAMCRHCGVACGDRQTIPAPATMYAACSAPNSLRPQQAVMSAAANSDACISMASSNGYGSSMCKGVAYACNTQLPIAVSHAPPGPGARAAGPSAATLDAAGAGAAGVSVVVGHVHASQQLKAGIVLEGPAGAFSSSKPMSLSVPEAVPSHNVRALLGEAHVPAEGGVEVVDDDDCHEVVTGSFRLLPLASGSRVAEPQLDSIITLGLGLDLGVASAHSHTPLSSMQALTRPVSHSNGDRGSAPNAGGTADAARELLLLPARRGPSSLKSLPLGSRDEAACGALPTMRRTEV